MTDQEIIDAYNVVAQDVRNRTAQSAAEIGNAQRSLGTLAERVASPTGQTSGLANYTYNRLLRPTVDSSAAALVTQGLSQALTNNLTNSLLAAKQRYNDAKNKYTVASTTPKTTTSTGRNPYTEASDKDYTPDAVMRSFVPYGTIDGVQYMWNPDTKHVVINGVEMEVTPEQWHQRMKQRTPGGGGGGGGW